MSYLAQTPHYFSPEEYPVPDGLPTGESHERVWDIWCIADANTNLSIRYSCMARKLNRIRFFRDCRVRMGVNSHLVVQHNPLSAEIISCRGLLDICSAIIEKFKDSRHAHLLFTMPSALREKLMADTAITSLRSLQDVSCLFPGGHPPAGGEALYLLYESASGYALFHAYAVDVAGQSMESARACVRDFESFRQSVRLTVFYPFPSAIDTLNECNAISQGNVTAQLRSILELYLSDALNIHNFTLGVHRDDHEPNLGAQIVEQTGIVCRSDGFVQELLRGVRMYFHRFVDLQESDLQKEQLRLGHKYSIPKVFSSREASVIHTLSNLDTLDKDIDSFSMRVREWSSVLFPELAKLIQDDNTYIKLAQFFMSNPRLSDNHIADLTGIIGSEDSAKQIIKAAKASMGHDLIPTDLGVMQRTCEMLLGLLEWRESVHTSLVTNMKVLAPNLSSLVGEVVGARLIAHADGLPKLAKYSKSSLKALGAKKSPSRGLTGGKIRKHGIIYSSTFVDRASNSNKDRMAECMAGKCLLASKEDCNSGEGSSSEIGEKLRMEAEEVLHKYEKDDEP